MLKKSTRLFTLAIASAAIIATTSTSFAAPPANSRQRGSGDMTPPTSREGTRSSAMDYLLNDGIIDQATLDEIQSYMETKRPVIAEMTEKTEAMRVTDRNGDILSEMLSEGIITQVEYDAIKSVKTVRFSVMDTFLESGVIDQATYDAINAYMEASKKTRAEMRTEISEKPASGERPEASEKLLVGEKPEVKDMFTELLENNIITQAQYEAMKAAIPQPVQQQVGENRISFKLNNPFEQLVENGTISQATFDAMKAYMENKLPIFPDGLSVEGGKTFSKDMFSELLENDIITQAQYDAIKASIPERPERLNRPE